VVPGDEVVPSALELDDRRRDRMPDELEAQPELVGPEERGLYGGLGQAENAAGDRGRLGRRARPMAEPAVDVPA
jgi:hypothetical protein